MDDRLHRFWSKTTRDRDTGCWLWLGYIDPGGYGRFCRTGAHRWAYERLVGPIPEGLQIDHLCRVRHCVNPAHLEPVTPAVNTRRSPIHRAALNRQKTHCHRGHELAGSNLHLQLRPGRTPKRHCRTCLREWAREHRRAAA